MLVTRISPFTLTENTLDLPVTAEQIARFESGDGLIQDIFPNLTADQREFILTGITAQEWQDNIAATEDEDDAEFVADVMADIKKYNKAMMAGDVDACLAVESKWGLLGLSPEQVSNELAAMAAPQGEAAF